MRPQSLSLKLGRDARDDCAAGVEIARQTTGSVVRYAHRGREPSPRHIVRLFDVLFSEFAAMKEYV